MRQKSIWQLIDLEKVYEATQKRREKTNSANCLDHDFGAAVADAYRHNCQLCNRPSSSLVPLRLLALDVFAFAEKLSGRALGLTSTERQTKARICAELALGAKDPAYDLARGRHSSLKGAEPPYIGSAWVVAMDELGYAADTQVESFYFGTADSCLRPDVVAAKRHNQDRLHS